MMSAKSLMSSVSRNVARNERHVSTSRHVMATYRVHLVESVDEFEDKVMKSDRPVVVDFTAGWCAPCQELLPMLEAAIVNAEIEVDLAKVDVSVLPELAANLKSVPTLLAVKNGKVLNTLNGLQDGDTLISFINQLED